MVHEYILASVSLSHRKRLSHVGAGSADILASVLPFIQPIKGAARLTLI